VSTNIKGQYATERVANPLNDAIHPSEFARIAALRASGVEFSAMAKTEEWLCKDGEKRKKSPRTLAKAAERATQDDVMLAGLG